jgi:protein-disulfide isomerase
MVPGMSKLSRGVLVALVGSLALGCRTAGPDATIKRLEYRIAVLEQGGKAGGEPEVALRLQRVESQLERFSEALEFLHAIYEQQKATAGVDDANEPDPDAMFAVDITAAVKAGQVEGPATAPVTIVKAFDFACPYCERLNQPLHELVGEYKGKLRVVYMNLVVHPDTAQLAHQYSCAAARQRKYVAWKDAFWARGFGPYRDSRGADVAAMAEPNLLALSSGLGLDTKKLQADANSEVCKRRIAEDMQELTKFRVSGTPTMFVNGQIVTGGIPKDEIRQLVEEKLAAVAKSGVPAAQYYDKVVMARGEKQFKSKAGPKS